MSTSLSKSLQWTERDQVRYPDSHYTRTEILIDNVHEIWNWEFEAHVFRSRVFLLTYSFNLEPINSYLFSDFENVFRELFNLDRYFSTEILYYDRTKVQLYKTLQIR